jgi:hypothetical protein
MNANSKLHTKLRDLSEGFMEVITYKWEMKLVKYNVVSDSSLKTIATVYYSE